MHGQSPVCRLEGGMNDDGLKSEFDQNQVC